MHSTLLPLAVIDCIRIRTRRGIHKGTLEGKGLYLTVYPELSPPKDIISFSRIIILNFCIVLQGRVILIELILSIPLSGMAFSVNRPYEGFILQSTS